MVLLVAALFLLLVAEAAAALAKAAFVAASPSLSCSREERNKHSTWLSAGGEDGTLSPAGEVAPAAVCECAGNSLTAIKTPLW
jgi:hypothetical protein